MPWLAPVTIATEFDISILLHSKAQVSVADHDQLSASLVSLHGAVRLTDLVEHRLQLRKPGHLSDIMTAPGPRHGAA